MKAFYCDHFVLPLPAEHRFPMEKYRLLRERVVAEGVVGPEDLLVPPPVAEEDLLRAHDPEYVRRVLGGTLERQEIRRVGFPWSPDMVERSLRSAGGTILACREALSSGTAVNLAGGTHHSFRDRGEGFCVFNDAAIASRALQAEGRVRRVVVIDTDVHQGNGTASIFREDPAVFTFSIHCRNNFPFHKEQSDLDVELDDGTADEAYLAALEDGLDRALSHAAADLAIFVSGADPHEGDRLGRLAVSREGLRARDRMVFERCGRAGLPVAVVMAGGYGRSVADTVDVHVQTVREAKRHWSALRAAEGAA